jgi:nitronate monooxygenase
MITTRFTELLGCSVPIQQAAIGGLATPALAAAVAESGGLGMVAAYWKSLDGMAATFDRAREKTSGILGANFILRFVDPTIVKEAISVAASKADIVEFFYSDPDASLVEIVHKTGALAGWQVGSREEAVGAADAGCDFVVVQGIEAGGHVRGRISLVALLDQVLESVDVPVLAAGGIGTGRAMAAALAMGADGVRVGTRFVAAKEAGAHPQYVGALIAAEAKDTVYTKAFSTGWPNAPHRVLRGCVEAAQAFEGAIVGKDVDPDTGSSHPIHRLAPVTISKSIRGAIEAMPHWAGESVGGVKREQPAAEIVRELVEEAERLLWRR